MHDPLLSQGRERNEEERTILRCMTGYRYSDRDIEQVSERNEEEWTILRCMTGYRYSDRDIEQVKTTPCTLFSAVKCSAMISILHNRFIRELKTITKEKGIILIAKIKVPHTVNRHVLMDKIYLLTWVYTYMYVWL